MLHMDYVIGSTIFVVGKLKNVYESKLSIKLQTLIWIKIVNWLCTCWGFLHVPLKGKRSSIAWCGHSNLSLFLRTLRSSLIDSVNCFNYFNEKRREDERDAHFTHHHLNPSNISLFEIESILSKKHKTYIHHTLSTKA